MSKLKVVVTLASLIVASSSAKAEGNWTVGVAALHSRGPYHGTHNLVAPLIMYEKNRFTLSTLDGLGYRYFDFSDNDQYEGSLSIIASPGIAPDFGDNAIYNGIDRNHGLDVGIQGNLKYGQFSMEFRSLLDVANSHNGYEVNAKISYQPASLPLELGVGVRYRDSKLNQYLFGVSLSESSRDRPAFTPDGAITGFVSAMVALPLSKNVISYLQVDYEDVGELTDSPLVFDNSETAITFGAIYQW